MHHCTSTERHESAGEQLKVVIQAIDVSSILVASFFILLLLLLLLLLLWLVVRTTATLALLCRGGCDVWTKI
jgi:hypothetical protein